MDPDFDLGRVVRWELHGEPLPDALFFRSGGEPPVDRAANRIRHRSYSLRDSRWGLYCRHLGEKARRDHFQLGLGLIILHLFFDQFLSSDRDSPHDRICVEHL